MQHVDGIVLLQSISKLTAPLLLLSLALPVLAVAPRLCRAFAADTTPSPIAGGGGSRLRIGLQVVYEGERSESGRQMYEMDGMKHRQFRTAYTGNTPTFASH